MLAACPGLVNPAPKARSFHEKDTPHAPDPLRHPGEDMSSGQIQFSEKALAEQNLGVRTLALTSTRAQWIWILFGVAALAFATLAIWGFFGTVVNSVSGQGILVLRGGVHSVNARSSGTITQLNVVEGMRVTSRQVVGEVYNAETMFSIRKLELEYDQLERQSRALTEGSEAMTKARLELERQREDALASLTTKYDESVARSETRSRNFGALRKQNAISLGEYFSSLDTLLGTEVQLLGNRLEVLQSSAQMRELDWEQKKTLITLENDLLLKALEVEMAHKLYLDAFRLVSDHDGRVLELRKRVGGFVQTGECVALIASDESEGLSLVGFFAPAEGKKISPGMSAYFVPGSVKPDEFGYIIGVVREVSEAPVSAEAVLAEVYNQALVHNLTGGNAAIRVVVELVPDPSAESGLRWTSKKGAPVKLSSGMLGSIRVNTEYRRPASFLVPYMKSLLVGK